MKKTLYDYLLIPHTATEDEIKQAAEKRISQFETLARNGDSKAKSMMLILKEAQQVLLKHDQRKEYDERIKNSLIYSDFTKSSNPTTKKNILLSTLFASVLVIVSFYAYTQLHSNTTYSIQEINGVAFLQDDSTPFTGAYIKKYPNGNLKETINYINGIKNGVNEEWHENGRISKSSVYKNGELDGAFHLWYEDGKNKVDQNFENGKPHGLRVQFYQNGLKELEMNYEYGVSNGPIYEWYDNGQKKREINLKLGKEDGHEIIWFKNGHKKSELSYTLGQKNGLLSSWYENGNKELEMTLVNNLENGLHSQWYEDGSKWLESYYQMGKIHGLNSVWHKNGKKKAEVLWENGALKKTISTWDESGNLIGGETLQIRLQEKADKITQLNAEKESAFRNLDNQRKLLEESERKKRLKKAEQYNSIRKAIRNNQVISGMTPHDVIESIGYPNNINRSLYGNQHHEQWVYSIGNYVYFTSGIVTSIQSYN